MKLIDFDFDFEEILRNASELKPNAKVVGAQLWYSSHFLVVFLGAWLCVA